jgi:23S rRNA (cytosine1962-C5)-methyltransferase
VLIQFPGESEVWTGYYNPHSLIAARVLEEGVVDIDGDWIEGRLLSALRYREKLDLSRSARRLVHGESDGLPGLIVDQYGKTLAIQSLTAGMDLLLPLVTDRLVGLLQPDCVLVRCDAEIREREGLGSWNRVVHGDLPENPVVECHGIRYTVDLAAGQKTGLFLDQMENIQTLALLTGGKKVLDACCYTGAFALSLAAAGAASVEAFDASGEAIDLAQRNAASNHLEGIQFSTQDVFEYFARLCREHRGFDLVNLDPPAFAKRKKDVENALKGYRELNRRAFKLLSEGGILCTSTCSHNITREDFLEMLMLAARDAGRSARIIEVRGQAADHPPLLAAPETRYLTCVILEVS